MPRGCYPKWEMQMHSINVISHGLTVAIDEARENYTLSASSEDVTQVPGVNFWTNESEAPAVREVFISMVSMNQIWRKLWEHSIS